MIQSVLNKKNIDLGKNKAKNDKKPLVSVYIKFQKV